MYDDVKPPPRAWGSVLGSLEQAGYLTLFLGRVALRIGALPTITNPVAKELRFIGARSTLVVAVAGLFIGMVVAVQFYDTLVRFGSVGLLGSVVGLSLVRELTPVVTALMVIARAGSSMAAEIGIMRTDHQVDALECMGIDPYRYLILPKLTATVFSLPLLVALFTVVGVLGGYLVGVLGLGVGSGTYFEGLYSSVQPKDLLMGMLKAITFGFVIGWICTGKGFLIHFSDAGQTGAAGVSQATTEAVVAAAIGILFADYVISAILV